jgi:hypothetical protein
MNRRIITAASLVAGVVAVIIMAIWGLDAATAPIPDDKSSNDTANVSDEPSTCPNGELPTLIKVVRRGEITVSVYNAGQRAGRARTTLDLLESAGFKAGEIGNAPDGSKVQVAEVHATQDDETKAHLVALIFGKATPVVIDDEQDLSGPGVSIYIGDKFRKLAKGAPTAAKLPTPLTTCS